MALQFVHERSLFEQHLILSPLWFFHHQSQGHIQDHHNSSGSLTLQVEQGRTMLDNERSAYNPRSWLGELVKSANFKQHCLDTGSCTEINYKDIFL